jgi:hypothetical protein
MKHSTKFRVIVIAGASFIAACAAPGEAPATQDMNIDAREQREVTYYAGTSSMTSPDGTIPFGPPSDVVVERVIDPAARTISENVIHPGRSFPTMLERVGDTTTFRASDAAASFSGTLTFSGAEWAWDAWTYDIAMADGSGTLRGRGTRSATDMKTEKTFYAPDGTPKMRLQEDLTRIDAKTYEAKREALLAVDAGSR